MTTRAVARTPARTRSRLVETLLGEVGAPIVSVDGGVSSSTWPPGVVSSDVVVSVQFSHRVLIETELVVVVVVSVQLMLWVLIEPVWVVVVSVVSSRGALSSEGGGVAAGVVVVSSLVVVVSSEVG